MARINWNRAKPARDTADAIGEGFVRKNGTTTKHLPKDGLAKRAARAESIWMRQNGIAIDAKGRIIKNSHGR